MSLSAAFSNAGAGLAVQARALQVASTNIALAGRAGYAVRSLELGSLHGGAPRVVAVVRSSDPVLAALRHNAAGADAAAGLLRDFWIAVEDAAGIGEAHDGLAPALARLESALVAAAERPDLDTRLAAVGVAASNLVARFARFEALVQAQRRDADAAIVRDVETLNAGLVRLHDLGATIRAAEARGEPALDLRDERDALLTDLSRIVPLRGHERSDGTLMVYAESGHVLLDLQPARIAFTGTADIGPGASLAGGQLSGLHVNGQPVHTGTGGPLSGGRLAAAFALRDVEAPQVQRALDALAESLVARFADPVTDPSAVPGAPGLFTDAGAALSLPYPPGLAGRLAINPLVLPETGGQLWRLRTGIGAASPGEPGDPAQLRRWAAALDRQIASTPGSAAASFGRDLAETLGGFGQRREAAEGSATAAAATREALDLRGLDRGVDTDAEMRRVLAIEAAYAANARVLQAADDMLRRILEI